MDTGHGELQPESAGPSTLRIERSGDGLVRLELVGELDLASADMLERELDACLSSGSAPVVLDLRRLEFISSSGLKVIMTAAEWARERGRRLVVLRGTAAVNRVLELTGIDKQVELVDELEDD